MLAQAAHLAGRRRVRLQERVRDPQRPEGHAERAEQPPPPEARDLQAPAPEVEQRPVLHRQSPDRPQEAVAGLLDARQRADRDPQLAPDTPDEGGPVGGIAESRGPGGDDPPHARAAGNGTEVPQGLVRALEAVGGDAPGPVQLPHEPQRGAAAGQDVQVPAGLLPVHHHAAGVRADVDHRHRRRPRVARPAPVASRLHAHHTPEGSTCHSGRPTRHSARPTCRSEGLRLDGSRGIRSLSAGGTADPPPFPAATRARGFASGPGSTGAPRDEKRPPRSGAARGPRCHRRPTSRRSAPPPRRSASGCRRSCAAGSSGSRG